MSSRAILIAGLAAVAIAVPASGDMFNITPANNIQATINIANDGDTINFAAGTYNQVANLGAKQLTLAGAGIGQTIISAAFLNDSVLRGSGIGSNMGGLVIRDLTIADGQTPTNSTGIGYPVDGGGLVLANSTVLLERVRFENNHANDDGGGFYAGTCTTTIVDCEFDANDAKGGGGGFLASLGTVNISGTTFTSNSALDLNAEADAGWGGGLYLVSQSASFVVTGCDFSLNEGTRGGAVYSQSTTGSFNACTFDENHASEGFGGVFYSRVSGALSVNDSTMSRNSAEQSGGAMYIDDVTLNLRRSTFVANEAVAANGGVVYSLGDNSTTIERCAFYGNSAMTIGGAVSSARVAKIFNSIFVENTAGGGGALSMNVGGSSVNYCTFYGNLAASQPIARTNATGPIIMLNCLATLNTPVDDTVGGANWFVQYSNIERSDPMAVVFGAGNINADPVFLALPSAGVDMMWGTVDDDFGDLRIAPGSPGIDAGDSLNLLGVVEDFDGNNRNLDDPATVNTGVSAWALCVDMGAYEYQPPAAPPACPGNANGDMVVDFDDITEVLANWQAVCP